MKKMVLIIILFASMGSISYAAYFPPGLHDTAQPHKPYKISYREFLYKYRGNNNALFIIKHFFRRRAAGRNMIIIGVPVATVAGIILFPIMASENPYAFLWYLLFGYCFFAGALLVLAGTILMLRFSRKRLWKTLDQLENGKLSPRQKRRFHLVRR